MPKGKNQRLKLIALKEILEQETDASHGLTMARIIELLSMRGISAERKSIYDDIKDLRDNNYLDIVGPQGRNREYAVASRDFEISELKMMIDAIQASKFLSEKKTRDLIKALEHQCSRHEAVSLQRQVVIANRVKTIASSNTLFGNVDRIHKAINLNAQITFKYFSYDAKKQKQYMRKGELYTASPWTMIYADDNYYLLAYEKGTFKHFRVDKMDNVTPCVETFELTGEEVVTLPHEGKEEFEKVDMSAYSKYTFSMYGGKIQNVTMRFQNRMMGVVMDRFGRDVVTTVVDKEHFQITVPVAISDQFYGWIFGLGNYVTIVSPDSVKEGMKKALAKVTKRYE